jgi:hypothetical protein
VRSIAATLLACTLACALACALAAAAGAASSVPPKDTFNGHIASASGGVRADHGNVTILIHAAQATAATRRAELTLVSPTCGRRKHCLRLLGTLTGTLTAQATIPDVGRRYAIVATGTITSLGRVSARGEADGVGFIREGRERLSLTLRTGSDRVTIAALSPEVPGFTSP